MKTTIAVSAQHISSSRCQVEWRVSKRKGGVLELVFPFENSKASMEIVSELAALNYLVTEKTVAGHTFLGGESLRLVGTKGAAKKIIQKRSDRKEAEKFASFIPFLLPDSELVIDNKYLKKNPVVFGEYERVTIDLERFTNTRYWIETPSIGPVALTYHSVQRFSERTFKESGKPKSPITALIKRIKNPELVQVDLPEDVKKHKAKKYGDNYNYLVFKHPTSTLNFAVVEGNNKRTLVTTFLNKQ